MSDNIVIGYTGYRKSFCDDGPDKMIERGQAWKKASETGLSAEEKHNIASLRKAQTQAEKEAQTTLATVAVQPDGLAQAQELLTGLAVDKARIQAEIDSLLAQPILQAFQVEVLDKYNLTTGSSRGNGNSSIGGMLKCVYHKTVRYYNVSDDAISVYASNGKTSELIVAFGKIDYPKLFPNSESALQRLHHTLYGEYVGSDKPATPTAKLSQVEKAYAKTGNWSEAETGLKTNNYNGNADVNPLDMTASKWLEKNPMKGRAGK